MELTKANAYRMVAMVESDLIWSKHYVPWADNLIIRLVKPPLWLLELSTTKYFGDAARVLREFVFSEPFEPVDSEAHYRDCIASLWLRYQRRELSWATFLDKAGTRTDTLDEITVHCEYFYEMLNDYADSGFAPEVEASQRTDVFDRFQAAIESLTPLYEEFSSYYPVKKQS